MATLHRLNDTLYNVIDERTSEIITYDKVTQHYDGSDMTDAKCDGDIYRKLGNEYFRKNLGVSDRSLEKESIADLRSLSDSEILLLKMGHYKSVRVLGYYQKGDTPAPVEYVMSSTILPDNNGSIIYLSNIKLEHKFITSVHCSYFGLSGTNIANSQNFFTYCRENNIKAFIGGIAHSASLLSLASGVDVSLISDTNTLTYNRDTYVSNKNQKIKGIKLPKNETVYSNWLDFNSDQFPVVGGSSTGIKYLKLILTEDVNINIDYRIQMRNGDSTLIIDGRGHSMTLNKFTRFSANKVILKNINFNLNIPNTDSAQEPINFSEGAITNQLLHIENCTFKQLDGTKKQIRVGRGGSGVDPINRDYSFIMKNCYSEGTAWDISCPNRVWIESSIFVANSNNEDNRELLHIHNPFTRIGKISGCVFINNIGVNSDLIDLYNSQNIVVDGNYFEGYFGTGREGTFLNIKTHDTQVLPQDHDLHGRKGQNKVINNIFKATGYVRGCVQLSNIVRDGSAPQLPEFTRQDIVVANNSFIFDNVPSTWSAIYTLGRVLNYKIIGNTHTILNPPVGADYRFMMCHDYNPEIGNTGDILILDNNSVYVDTSNENILSGYTFLRMHLTTTNVKVTGNLSPSNTTAIVGLDKLPGLVMNNNSFDPKGKGITSDRPALSNYYKGFLFFDETLNKPIWWSGTSWVDATGATV